MNVTLQAAVHLGRDYMENLQSTKNQPLKSLGQLFQTTERLTRDQTEITGLSTIDWKQLMWRETSLLCDKAAEITNDKTFVFSDSVLCLGSISAEPVEAIKNKFEWYLETRYLKDLNRIDGEPMEFGWTFFQDSLRWEILEEIQNMMTELQCEPEQFKSRIIFMSMYNDIVWRERGNTEKCIVNSVSVVTYARRFTRRHWSFPGPGSDKKWCFQGLDRTRNGTEPILINQMEIGTKLLNN